RSTFRKSVTNQLAAVPGGRTAPLASNAFGVPSSKSALGGADGRVPRSLKPRPRRQKSSDLVRSSTDHEGRPKMVLLRGGAVLPFTAAWLVWTSSRYPSGSATITALW